MPEVAPAEALPPSLSSWLPLLWRRSSSPGPRSPQSRLSWRALLLLLILPSVLLYPCLAFPLFEPDEGRYAEIPREMLAARRMGGAVLAGRAVPRQAAAVLLAGDAQLPGCRRPRLGGAAGAGAGGPRLRAADVPAGPARPGRAAGVLGGRPPRGGAGVRGHGPTAAARRPADVLGDAGAVGAVRGAARRAAALGLVAAGGRGVRPRRADQGAGGTGAAGRRRPGHTGA